MSFLKLRAVQLWTAFFVLLISFEYCAFAADKKTENYKDIIEKAENLSLQKDRQQAVVILAQAIKRENPNGKIYFELKKELAGIANLFYSEKAQELYELSISLRKSDLNQAQIKIQEALRIEPDNLSLIIENTRLLIAKNECSQAYEQLQKQKSINPYDEVLLLTQAQAAICLGDIENYFAIRTFSENQKKSSANNDWQRLDLERLVKEKNYTKAKEALAGLIKSNKQNPEILYWSWRIDFEMEKKGKQFAEQYLAACKNIATHIYRKYLSDALLCKRTKEIENYLKSNNGTN